MGKSVRKICLLGASYETGNMGVSALTASLVQIISRLAPDAEIALLIPHDRITERYQKVEGKNVLVKSYPFRLSPRSDPAYNVIFVSFLSVLARVPFLRSWAIRMSPLLRLIEDSDFIGDIHGGDSFADMYQYARIWQSSRPLLWILRLGKPLHMLPQTYGPFNTMRGRHLARKVLTAAASIVARDEESRDFAMRVSGRQGIEVVPDVAFCMEAVPAEEGFREIAFPDASVPVVGINISGLLYHGGFTKDNMFGLKMDYPEFSFRLLERLLEETRFNIALIPHTVSVTSEWHIEDDRVACRETMGRIPEGLRGRVRMLEGNYDQGEIKAVIGRCSLFAGARMHACIAAISQGIPTIGIAYSKKFKGVFGVAGVSDWVLPAKELGTDEALDFCLGKLPEAERTRAFLKESIPKLRERIFSGIGRILENQDA
jgi:colanic acid/amylovoran biosynthesis protein